MLSKQLHSHDSAKLEEEMLVLPAFRRKVDARGWRDLIELAPQLMDAPRSLGQHVGGMILSESPISGMVPIREGAIEGRYIMDWNKDSVADANFAKIDLLSLPVLDQLEEALDLIERREGGRPDLSRIDPEDPGVYDMINQGRSKGVFLLQSPAQLKMGQRLKSRSLLDLAYQVALIRPGVGVQGSSVSQFVERYRHGASWEYDHPLEQRALERGYGIIVWQEQVVQLIMDVAGFTAAQADEVRRAFAKPHSEHLIAMHRERFLEGAQSRGVPRDVAERIFAKINGHYMFPESHSHALAVPAYQATWLKRYYPLEFFVTLMNNQPMSFYPLETLKEDAKRFGLPFLNPCVNLSQVTCIPDQGCVLLGLQVIKDVGERAGKLIVEERERHGLYKGAGDLVRRTGLKPQAGPVLGDGWGLRQHHSQPPRGPLGCRAPHPSPHDDAPGGGSYSRQLCRTGGQYNPSSAQPREPHKNHRSPVGAPPSPTVPPGGVSGAAPTRPAAQQPRSSGTAGAKGSQLRRCRRVHATEQGRLVGRQRPRRSPATSGVGCQRCTGTHPGRILRLRRLGSGDSRPDRRVFFIRAFAGKTMSNFADDQEGLLTK